MMHDAVHTIYCIAAMQITTGIDHAASSKKTDCFGGSAEGASDGVYVIHECLELQQPHHQGMHCQCTQHRKYSTLWLYNHFLHLLVPHLHCINPLAIWSVTVTAVVLLSPHGAAATVETAAFATLASPPVAG